MATPRERVEGHVAPALVRVLGPRRFARLGISLGAKELGKERADWLAGLMGDQDRKLMISAWKETMSFDSRTRLAEIACPTLVVAGSKDRAVPMLYAEMLHDAITGSQLVVVDGGGHTLIWTHPTRPPELRGLPGWSLAACLGPCAAVGQHSLAGMWAPPPPNV
jgi:pimeloyl-ACP methyl ester carboxylesterase